MHLYNHKTNWLIFIFRYQNYTSKKIEECSYYDRNYSIFAKNGYNWSMNNLETATSKPCQYYRYSYTKSVVSEVRKRFSKLIIIGKLWT